MFICPVFKRIVVWQDCAMNTIAVAHTPTLRLPRESALGNGMPRLSSEVDLLSAEPTSDADTVENGPKETELDVTEVEVEIENEGAPIAPPDGGKKATPALTVFAKLNAPVGRVRTRRARIAVGDQ